MRWYSGWVKTYSGKIVTSLEGLGKCSYVICEVNVTGSDNVIWWQIKDIVCEIRRSHLKKKRGSQLTKRTRGKTVTMRM